MYPPMGTPGMPGMAGMMSPEMLSPEMAMQQQHAAMLYHQQTDPAAVYAYYRAAAESGDPRARRGPRGDARLGVGRRFGVERRLRTHAARADAARGRDGPARSSSARRCTPRRCTSSRRWRGPRCTRCTRTRCGAARTWEAVGRF